MPSGRSKQVIRISIVLCAMYALLAARLYHVQVTQAAHFGDVQENLQSRSRYKRGSTLFERPARASILDRNGNKLAVGFKTYKLILDMKPDHLPRRGQEKLSIAQRIGVLCGVLGDLGVEHDEIDILEKAQRGTYKKVINGEERILPKRGIILLKGIYPSEREYIKKVMRKLRIANFGFILESAREYPYGKDVAEIVGFVGKTKKTGDTVAGRAGIELKLDEVLAARPGKFFCEKDGHGRELEMNGHWIEKPEAGWDVHLTLDVDIQKIAGEALAKACKKAKCPGGVAIVMDSQTGEILAMKSHPEVSVEDIRAKRASPGDFQCRAVSMILEPGSTFKPLVLAKAIEQNAVTWTQPFNTNNGYRVFTSKHRKRGLKDSHPHGTLTSEEIIIQSSNIGMAMIGWEKMGYPKLMDAIDDLKLSGKLNLFMPGIAKSDMPLRHAKRPIYPGVSVPFGHQIALSPLAMTAVFNVFATGGVYHQPKIVRHVARGEEWLPNEKTSTQMIREDIADRMLTVLHRTTTEGTAKVVGKLPWHVGAKTGTAQILGVGHRAFNSSMIAIAPVSNPKITVYVCLFDVRIQAATGGQTAGPAVAEIIQQSLEHMRVPKDREEGEK